VASRSARARSADGATRGDFAKRRALKPGNRCPWRPPHRAVTRPGACCWLRQGKALAGRPGMAGDAAHNGPTEGGGSAARICSSPMSESNQGAQGKPCVPTQGRNRPPGPFRAAKGRNASEAHGFFGRRCSDPVIRQHHAGAAAAVTLTGHHRLARRHGAGCQSRRGWRSPVQQPGEAGSARARRAAHGAELQPVAAPGPGRNPAVARPPERAPQRLRPAQAPQATEFGQHPLPSACRFLALPTRRRRLPRAIHRLGLR